MRLLFLLTSLTVTTLFVSCADETPTDPAPSGPELVPLEVEDTWVYSEAGSFDAFVDRVTEFRTIGGRGYHRIEGNVLGSILGGIGEGNGWVRFDASRLRVLPSEQGAEETLFDLDRAPGETWTIDGRRVQREENEAHVEVPFGRFDDVPAFIYDAASPDSWKILLVPGVGVIRAVRGSGGDPRVYEFRKGRVGGEVVR